MCHAERSVLLNYEERRLLLYYEERSVLLNYEERRLLLYYEERSALLCHTGRIALRKVWAFPSLMPVSEERASL